MKEIKLWFGILPFVAAFVVFEYATATKFDFNEVETAAYVGGALRFGTHMLKFKAVRAVLREKLDSYEKHEKDALP